MVEHTCKECQFFLQHYTFDKSRIFRVYCGHCTHSRAKHKYPDTKACTNYKPGTGPEDSFVSKEYLSKKLLQYMLSLDLLPEIETK